jgi:hypothetical protein
MSQMRQNLFSLHKTFWFALIAILLCAAAPLEETWPQAPTQAERDAARDSFLRQPEANSGKFKEYIDFHPSGSTRQMTQDHTLLVFTYSTLGNTIYGIAELKYCDGSWVFKLADGKPGACVSTLNLTACQGGRCGNADQLEDFKTELFENNEPGWISSSEANTTPPSDTVAPILATPTPIAMGGIPGLGGTERVPGPDNLGQAIIGILLPALICLIASLILKPTAGGAALAIKLADSSGDETPPAPTAPQKGELVFPAALPEPSPARIELAQPPSPAEEAGEPVWSLVAQEGTLKPGEIIALSEKLTLGRRKTNDVRIKDAQASLNHAVIERRGDGYWLVDQGSENGTFLNEKKIAEATRLKDGDLIQIAKVIYRVQKS